MVLGTVLIVLQVLGLLLIGLAGHNSAVRKGKKPLYEFGTDKEDGSVEWRPYFAMRYKHPLFLRMARKKYLEERPKDIDNPGMFRDAEEKALYELRTGRADIRRYLDEEFWNEWSAVVDFDGSAAMNGNLQPIGGGPGNP